MSRGNLPDSIGMTLVVSSTSTDTTYVSFSSFSRSGRIQQSYRHWSNRGITSQNIVAYSQFSFITAIFSRFKALTSLYGIFLCCSRIIFLLEPFRGDVVLFSFLSANLFPFPLLIYCCFFVDSVQRFVDVNLEVS